MKAAIDIGSNSLRLLVLDDKNNVIRQEVEETRLGKGLEERILPLDRVDATLKVISRWTAELNRNGITPGIFATSAVRDASNGSEFAAKVKDCCGVDLRILSGEEEAYYSFKGSVGGFDFPAEECLLIDIGGGSTELAAYDGTALRGVSMQIGAVRWQVMDARREKVKEMIAKTVTMQHWNKVAHFIGVGGTVTTVGAVLKGVKDYSREAVHGYYINYAALTKLKRELSAMTLEERRKIPGMPAARAEIIVYGMEILEILFEVLNMPGIYVSDWGILDGFLSVN